MRPMHAAVLAALFLTGCASTGATTAAPPGASCGGAVAIMHVTVLPMSDVAELRDQTVITSGDRIVRVGPSERVRAPRRACLIDGRGRFLMPGLADAHVHLYDEGDLTLDLRFGVTSVLNMGGSHMHLRLREALAAGAMDGPTLYTTGPMLKIDATPLVEFEETPRSAADAGAMIAGYHAAGYDFVKVWGAFAPEMYETIVAAARAGGMRVTGHIPREVGLSGVLASEQLSIAHVEELLNKHFRAIPSEEQMASAAAELSAADATVTTTLVTYEAIAAANADDSAALQSRPGSELMDPVRLAMWGPGANRLRGGGRDPQRTMRALAAMQSITQALQAAGVPLLVGTDAGELPGLVPGLDIHRELELMVEAGLRPEEALRAATANFGAYMAGSGDRFGVIEIGARADLLLLDADPRADISNTRAIRGVMARGAFYDRADLEAMVARLQERNRRTAGYVGAVMSGGLEQGAAYISEQRAQGQVATALTPVLFMALGSAQRGDLAGAEALLRQVAAVYPDREEPWFIIAGLRILQDDAAGALAAYDEAAERAPDHERVQRERRRLRTALTAP